MKIGLIGVGNMGTPLLRKLINNKYNASVLLENNNNSNYDCMTFKNNELNPLWQAARAALPVFFARGPARLAP